jgi:hypothetical protein
LTQSTDRFVLRASSRPSLVICATWLEARGVDGSVPLPAHPSDPPARPTRSSPDAASVAGRRREGVLRNRWVIGEPPERGGEVRGEERREIRASSEERRAAAGNK